MNFRYTPSLKKLILCTAFCVAMGATVAFAHSWYPAKCCSGTDCKPVPCDSLVELKGGDMGYVDENGKAYRFAKEKINPSEDNECHVCIHATSDQPLCVFIINSF